MSVLVGVSLLFLAVPPEVPAPVDASALAGSVASGTATDEPLPLSLKSAIDRGLEHNLALVLSEENVRSAQGKRREALADLLPQVSARVTGVRQKINLAAFGLSVPGFPDVVGPFNLVEARAGFTQAVIDVEALQKVRARDAGVEATRHTYQDTRDLVVLVCGNFYLRALAEQAKVESARSQLDTATTLRSLAADRKQAGQVPALEVLRADVELSTRHQQLIVAENRAARAKLSLARAIGLPLGQALVLTDRMPNGHAAPPPLADALAEAYVSRSDWKSALDRVRAAEADLRAARGERLPSVAISADYGSLGQSVATARTTFTLGAAVRVPLFEGGRAQGKALQADATLAAAHARLEDLRGRIDYDVRTASLDIGAASERVEVAARGLELATDAVRQARDRFEAGVASNIEVVQAQQSLAAANEDEIESAYDLSAARAALARALGKAEAAFAEFVKGE